VSGTTRLPDWLTVLKERDELAFPAHAALGNILTVLGCSPAASGLQWLKAAAHARTPPEITLASDGLLAVAEHFGSSQALSVVLCPFVAGGYARPSQQQAAERAGLVCSLPVEADRPTSGASERSARRAITAPVHRRWRHRRGAVQLAGG